MSLVLAIATSLSGAAATLPADDARRDAMIAAVRGSATASVTILAPTTIDIARAEVEGQNAAMVRRDDAGTLWIEFS